MMYGMPVLIFIFGVYAPSGVALYWAVSNAYQVLQTYFLNNPFKIIAERAVVQAQKDLEGKIEKKKPRKRLRKRNNKEESGNGSIYRFNCWRSNQKGLKN